MNERTRKQVALLLLGIFLGYSFFQFNKTIVEYSEQSIEKPIKVQQYGFSKGTIKTLLDDLELHFSIVPRTEYDYWGRGRGAFFNISLVNPTNEIIWIKLQENYYYVGLYRNDTVICKLTGELDNFVEPEYAFLAPNGGRHTVYFFWGGVYSNEFGRHYVPDGVYNVRCVFWLNEEKIVIEGHTMNSYTKMVNPSRTI